ncbi:MAG: hypothetical protein K2U26_04430 [Cyclobacteriaceae bacterium]|nr:hypothetical protein [Cyclobacteriaceae bacterium]
MTKKFDFIVLATITDFDSDNLYCSINTCLKGGTCPDNDVDNDVDVINRKELQSIFILGRKYLIFGSAKDRCQYFIDEKSKLIAVEENDHQVEFLKSILPCQEPELKQTLVDHACHRIYRPVCGCDSVTYGNACEALKNGILIFDVGECPRKSRR